MSVKKNRGIWPESITSGENNVAVLLYNRISYSNGLAIWQITNMQMAKGI
jgi:hypothetical protein